MLAQEKNKSTHVLTAFYESVLPSFLERLIKHPFSLHW